MITTAAPHTSKAPCQPSPALASGTFNASAKAAAATIATVKNAVTCPTRVGYSAFTTAGSSTFPNAVPMPTIAVPMYSPATPAKLLSTVPSNIRHKPMEIVCPSPQRRPNPPASELTAAKAISGSVVSSPEALPESPRLSVISGSSGPTPVIIIRRQNATNMTLSIMV